MDKEKLKHELKRHLSDSTAIMTVANPIYAGLETMVVGMSDPVSINSRLISTASIYGGTGSLTKVRDFSKKLFKIGKKSKEYWHGLHDVTFAAIFILGIKPLTYLAAGETDFNKIVAATGLSVLTAGAIAYPMGYLVDAYRDLTGVEQSGRLPDFVEKQSPKVKKTLATMMTAASVAAATAVYCFNGR